MRALSRIFVNGRSKRKSSSQSKCWGKDICRIRRSTRKRLQGPRKVRIFRGRSIWPTDEKQLSVIKQRGDDQCITANTDIGSIHHNASKLHHAGNITFHLRGSTKIENKEQVLAFSIEPDSSDINYNTLAEDQYDVDGGRVPVKRKVRNGKRNGVVKTKAKSANPKKTGRRKDKVQTRIPKQADDVLLPQENQCFEEKSLQSLAVAIPADKLKMVGRELDIKHQTVERMFTENIRNVSEFAICMLLHWRDSSKAHERYDQMVTALEELELNNLSTVVKTKYAKNERMRSSDFRCASV